MARTKQVARKTPATTPAPAITKPSRPVEETVLFRTLRLTNTLEGRKLQENPTSQPNYVEHGKQLTADEIIEKERERGRISSAVHRQKKKQAAIDEDSQQSNGHKTPASNLEYQQPVTYTTAIFSNKECRQHIMHLQTTPYAKNCPVLFFNPKVTMAVPAQVLSFKLLDSQTNEASHPEPRLLPSFKNQFKNILTSLEQEKGLGRVKKSLR